MPYTDEQIIELAAIKVQEVVVPKVEAFTEGVVKEVHQMHLEMKDNKEFNAAVIAQLNDVRAEVAKFEDISKLVAELHTLLCRDGYMQRFNELHKTWTSYLSKDRILTCPVIDDVKENNVLIKENSTLIKENAIMFRKDLEAREERSNGKVKSRREDKFRIITIVVAVVVAVASWLTLITKLMGIW